jgi:hypothetical protein
VGCRTDPGASGASFVLDQSEHLCDKLRDLGRKVEEAFAPSIRSSAPLIESQLDREDGVDLGDRPGDDHLIRLAHAVETETLRAYKGGNPVAARLPRRLLNDDGHRQALAEVFRTDAPRVWNGAAFTAFKPAVSLGNSHENLPPTRM